VQPTQLYLDTARLGQMSRHAQDAQFDFARLAGNEGASPLFEHFLEEGSSAWPATVRSMYPGLTCWQGIGPLKQSLRKLAGSDPTLPLLMVNRSAQLMRFAARLLFRWCRNVLVTDLGWPAYRQILDSEARRTGGIVTSVEVRALICRGQTTEADVISHVRQTFLEAGCDGLFLTAVSHLGFRLPVERVVRTLESARELRSVVIDGAQDFCHASADLSNEYCDLYLAGCHKWLQGFHPMGLGFYGRRRSQEVIDTLVKRLLASGDLDDPLLRFTTQIEGASLDGDTETVNLIPLFSCQGAVEDALQRRSPLQVVLSTRQQNLALAAELAASCGWRSILPAEPFRTGILLLQAERAATRLQSSTNMRRVFADQGVALTAYNDGMVRLSMPGGEWHAEDVDRLRSALQAAA
jgi:selenocysteine lyase/cysteine desulfurase